MGYRGSKSVVIDNCSTVKEQRVDGSSVVRSNPSSVRCTLAPQWKLGFEYIKH